MIGSLISTAHYAGTFSFLSILIYSHNYYLAKAYIDYASLVFNSESARGGPIFSLSLSLSISARKRRKNIRKGKRN